MRHVVTALFLLAGIVNFLPVIGVLGEVRLESLYGIDVAGDDLLLLMRHRAVLFGILGGFMMLAAFRAHWRTTATVAGLISMVSYLVLALPLASHGAPIQKVFWMDVVAVVLLQAGFLLSRRLPAKTAAS
jgi:hypothetical protein